MSTHAQGDNCLCLSLFARARLAGEMAFRRDLPREDRIHVSSCLCCFIMQSNEDSGQTYFRSVIRQRMFRIQFSLSCFQPEFFHFQSQYLSFPASIAGSHYWRIKPRRAIVAIKVALVKNNIRRDGKLVPRVVQRYKVGFDKLLGYMDMTTGLS